MLELFASLLLGYLIGGVPSAALVARLRHRDVFEVGSGNMGAMNTARNLGFALGVLVLVLDVGKGALASSVGLWIAGLGSAGPELRLAAAVAAGFGAVSGHAFSPYVAFRGGKGLATTLGIALPLYPIGGLLGVGLLVVLTLALRHHSDLAAVLTMVLYPALVAYRLTTVAWPAWAVTEVFVGVAAVAVVVIVKHLLALRRGRGKAAG